MATAPRARAAHMTFTVPEALKERAQARRDVNWSAVVTQTIQERLKALDLMDRLLARSRLTLKDVDEIADAIDTAVARRHGLVK
jgi:hypothetical protein